MDQIVAWLDQHHVGLATIVATIALVVAASVGIVLLNRLLRRWLVLSTTRLHWPYGTVMMILRVVSGALWVITALMVLDIWGVGIGGLWAVLASAAAVIGVGFLATWTMISNFTASFFIAVWRPFHLGQIVEIVPENLKGRVIDRNLMFTALREESGSVVEIPNNLFFQKMFRVIDSAQFPFELLETGTAAPSRRPGSQRPQRQEAFQRR
jgi:small-conductance mechanosensitive channel